MFTDFIKLKSGSDIRGTASEGVKGMDVELTNEVVQKIIGAFALYISGKINKSPNNITISVGNDSRISGGRIN
ncbi:MAG: phosphomannomutase/phosphoglucomutase, partial [Clostridia bacterium]|nr:phosphomannomutase/phosphoglucomutase [Clostridia bacterium]